MNDEILQNIWNQLTADGMTNSDFETWKSNFAGSEDIQKNVHGYLLENNHTDSDIDTWSSNVGLKKKDESDLSVLEKDLVFGTNEDEQDGSSDGSEVTDEEIPEVVPEVLETETETETEVETETGTENVVVTEEEKKTTDDKKQFLISQNINIDALFRQARFGNPSTGQGGDFTGTEEEFVDRYYATYLVDKGITKTQIDFDSAILKPKEDREATEGYETDVAETLLDRVKIDPTDYKAWEEETTREESKAFKWVKNLLTTDKTEAFNKEQRDFEKIASYKASVLGKLNDDINLLNTKLELAKDPTDILQLQNIKGQLEAKYIEELQQLNGLANLFPTLKKYTIDRDLERRKNIYDAAHSDDNVGEVTSEVGNVLKTIPVALGDFTMGSLAFITSGADQALSAVGFDQKGLLAGLTERFLDGQESFEQFIDPVQRSGIIDGKEVTVNGKEYIVTYDGSVLDRKSHVKMNGIISDDLIKEVQERSKKVLNSDTFFDGGGVVSSGFTTMANLVALIRGGRGLSKVLKVSPGVGMGLASYGSSMASEVESMRADLMAAGLTEKEAMDKAIIAGNAIASLDGLFSGLAGGNQKVLSNLAGFKQQVINIVKKDGAKFSKDELKRKFKDLGIEMGRETFIEELPVLFSTKAVNAAVNYSVGREVRSAEVSQAEILETVILTLGATGTLGGKTLINKNTRLDALRYVGMNINDLQGTIDQLVKNGEITAQEGQNVYQEVYDMQAAELKTKGTITNSNNMLETSDLLQQRQQLISQREGLEGPLKEDLDKKIEDVDQQINEVVNRDKKETEDKLKTEKDSIQEEITVAEAGKNEKVDGFDKAPVYKTGGKPVLFHGSTKKFTEFDIEKIGSGADAGTARGIFFTSDPEVASFFSKETGSFKGNVIQSIKSLTGRSESTIYSGALNTDNIKTVDFNGQRTSPEFDKNKTIQEAFDQGFDAVILKNIVDGNNKVQDVTVVKDMSVIEEFKDTQLSGNKLIKKYNQDAIQKSSAKAVDDKKSTSRSKKVESPVLDSKLTGKSKAKTENKTKTKTQEEIDSLNKKIEEVRVDSKINRPTKAARIKELNDKISKLKAQAETETNIEEEVELTENQDLDRDSRLKEQEVKEAQKEEGYTVEKEGSSIDIDIAGKKRTIPLPFSKTINNAKRTLKRLFQSAGNLPKTLFKAQESKRGEYNQVVARAERKASEYNRLFDKLRKQKNLDENTLIKLNEDLGKVLKGELKIQDINFKNNKGETKAISSRLAKLVTEMRSDIDAMSQQILESPNIAKKDAKKTIKSQIGKYITRSYRLFEGKVKGKKFKETLSEDVLNEAREFFKKDEGFIKEVKTESKKTNEKFEDALKRMTETKINDLLNQKISNTDFLNRYVGDGKNLNILKEKKEVPPAIRKLYGEITDPVANYINTMIKTGTLLTQANFVQSVYENGIGKYIFTKNDPNRPSDSVEIASPNNENYKPLDGLYTYPDIRDGLFPRKGFLFQRPEGKAGYLYDLYLKVMMAYPRAAKTILSPSTQIINFVSNVNFAIVNGHLPVSIVNGRVNFDAYKKAVQGTSAIITSKSNKEIADKIETYNKLGIIDQSVDVNELKDLLNQKDGEKDLLERFSQDPTYRSRWTKSKFNPKNWYKFAEKSYRVGDDFWKIMGYEMESQNLAKVYFNKDFDAMVKESNVLKEKGKNEDSKKRLKDLNEEIKQIQEEAAEMVKNQYPNYSRIPKLARFFKGSPFLGNFISFQAESYRTAYNTVANSFNMLAKGNKLINDKTDVDKGKRLRKEGLRKIANTMSYIAFRDGAFYALATKVGGKVLGGFLPLFGLGFDDDEPEEEAQTFGQLTAKELAIRNFVYKWQKNQKLIITKAEDGQLNFVDASTFDPHQLLEANISALMQSKNFTDALKGVTVEQLETFAGIDFVLQAALDAKANYDRQGKNRSIIKDALQPFFRRAFLPGAILQLEDAFGKGILSGRDLTKSKIAKLVGYRDYEIDVSRQLYFNLQPEREAQMLSEQKYYNDVTRFIEKNQITEEGVADLIKLYEKTNQQRKESFLYTYEQIRAALLLGVEPEKIERTLRGRKINFSKKEINAIVQAAYIPLKEMPPKFRRKKKKKSQTEKDLGL